MANYLKDLWNNADSALSENAESMLGSIPRGVGKINEEQRDNMGKDKPNVLLDIAKAPIRGIEGVVHGTYGLLDMISFDALPDWKDEDRLFGRSETIAGGFVEGLSQFLIPFFPLKAAMKAGKLGQAMAKLGGKRSDTVRDVAAGTIVDFAAFDGHEERLSNLINIFPTLRNPVTDYLAAEDTDTEAEGRFKNAIEGIVIEAGMRGIGRGLFSAVKAIKLHKSKQAAGNVDEATAQQQALDESGFNDLDDSEFDFIENLENQIDAGKETRPNEIEINKALEEDFKLLSTDPESVEIDDTFDFLPNLRKVMSKLSDEQRLEDHEILDEALKAVENRLKLGRDDELDTRILEYNQRILKIYRDSAKEQYDRIGGKYGGNSFEGNQTTKEEIKAVDEALDNMGDNPKTVNQDTNFKDMSWNELRAEAKRQGLGGQGTRADIIKRLEDNLNPRPNTDVETGQGQLLGPDQATGKFPNFRTSKTFQEAQRRKGEKRPVNKEDNTFQSGPKDVESSRQLELNLDDTKLDTERKVKQPKGPEALVMNLVSKFKKDFKNKGERGFAQALAGSVRNVANSSNMMIVARALAVHLEDTIDMSSKSFEDIVADAKNYSAELGVNDHDYLAKIYDAKGDVKELRRVMAQQEALRTVNLEIGQQLRETADKYAEVKRTGKGNLDEIEVELMGLLEKHRETQRIWSLYGRDLSRAFLQRKAYYIGSGPYNRRIALSKQELASAADRVAYKKRNIGSMKTEELVAKIRKAVSPDQVIGGIIKADNAKLNAITKGTDGSRMMNITMEYWMNSLLSSPATQVVNVLGNMSIYLLRAGEEYVGAAFNGDKELMQAIAKYTFKAEGFHESWRLFKAAFKDDNSRLIPDARVYDDSVERSHAIYKEGDDAFANAINWIGTVVRAPSRLLLAGDEFFKQLNYRYFIRTSVFSREMAKNGANAKVAAERAEKALQMSLTKDGRMLSERNLGMEAYNAVNKMDDDEYLKSGKRMSAVERETEMKRYFESQGNNLRSSFLGMDQVDERLRLPDAAADYARISTATKDIPQIQEPLSRLAHYFPLAKMVFPFVRTPTNLLKMGLERTVLGGGVQIIRELSQGKFLEQARDTMKNGTNREKAQLKGKMATAVATTTGLTMYIASNSEFISGGGPRSKEEREALKLTGWQPYSIKVEILG